MASEGDQVIMVMVIEPEGQARYGIFSSDETAAAWREKQVNSTITMTFVVDVPEYGNEAERVQ